MSNLEQKIGYLKTIDIFQDLSKEEMLKMEKSITMSTCQAGKVFFRPDDTAQVLFIYHFSSLKSSIYKCAEGR